MYLDNSLMDHYNYDMKSFDDLLNDRKPRGRLDMHSDAVDAMRYLQAQIAEAAGLPGSLGDQLMAQREVEFKRREAEDEYARRMYGGYGGVAMNPDDRTAIIKEITA